MSSKYSYASSEVSTSEVSTSVVSTSVVSTSEMITVFTPPTKTIPGNYCDYYDILLLEILILVVHCLIKLIATFKETIIKSTEVQNPCHRNS